MKKALLIALLLAFVAGTAIAQNNHGFRKGPGGNGDNHRVERMTEKLGLDEAQQAQITAIFETSQTLHAAEQENFREKSREIRDSANTEIQAVLTAEQAAVHAALQQQRADFRHAHEDTSGEGGRGRGGRGGRGTGECGN